MDTSIEARLRRLEQGFRHIVTRRKGFAKHGEAAEYLGISRETLRQLNLAGRRALRRPGCQRCRGTPLVDLRRGHADGEPEVPRSMDREASFAAAMLQVTNSFTVEDMSRFAGEAWGPLGVSIVDRWCEFNVTYFANELRPIPLMITQTQPYGHLIGKCSGAGNLARVIQLNVPRDEYAGRQYPLLADNGTLLHEMVHQLLHERGEDAAHMSNGWRREIMRLNKKITGVEIWAGPSVVRRIDGKSTRLNAPHANGTQSLTQAVIARWPHDEFGIHLGALGEVQRVAACSGGKGTS